jgi:hypothetical protein
MIVAIACVVEPKRPAKLLKVATDLLTGERGGTDGWQPADRV